MTTAESSACAFVLIVDDDDAVRQSLKFMLELEGLKVQLFESGEALLSQGALPERGCLVVDQKMPRLSGVDLLRRLKERCVELPAILITGRLTQDLVTLAMAAGFAAVMEKPLEGGGLIDAVRLALARP